MINFAAGQPIGPTQIQAIESKINSLCEALEGDFTTVSCVPVGGNLRDGACLAVGNAFFDSTVNNSQFFDKKLISLSVDPSIIFTTNSEDSAGRVVSYRLVIKCNDDQIFATNFSESEEPFSVLTSRDCPRDGAITICFEVRESGGFIPTNNTNVDICGFVLCIADVSAALTGVFKPPVISEGCCGGSREALCLAAQNLNAIRNSLLANRDQFVTCKQVQINGDGSSILASNIATQSEFVVFGMAIVCVRNTEENIDYQLTVNPVVGCEQNLVTCLDSSISVPRNSGGQGEIVCLRVPVSACGSCPAGSDIYAGLTVDSRCEEDVVNISAGTGLEIVSVVQVYCAWIFGRSDISALPDEFDFALGSCVFDEDLAPMQESCEALEKFIDGRTPPNCTYRDLGTFQAALNNQYVIQAAQPWPPINDPTNPDPVPTKKWNVSINACSFFSNAVRTAILNSGSADAVIMIEVYCGGTVVASATESWQVYQIGGNEVEAIRDFTSRCVTINRCIECDIDQDLSIVASGQVNTNLVNPIGINVYQASMFCF